MIAILGISCFYHDASACLLVDGKIVAAAQEERFTRIKHDPSFPSNAIRYCLEAAGIQGVELDIVVFYEKPHEKFRRIISSFVDDRKRNPNTFSEAMSTWIPTKYRQRKLLAGEMTKLLGGGTSEWEDRIRFSRHHLSHAASAFYASPYRTAAVLTMDGVGEWESTTIYHGVGNKITQLAHQDFPHSIGLLYSAFTHYCGFRVNSGEYKLMGLAPYGKPTMTSLIWDNLLQKSADGGFSLNLDYFDFRTGNLPTNRQFWDLFGRLPREPEGELEAFHMDIAASIQEVTEQLALDLARAAKKLTGEVNLCLAGGVALNCVANARLRREAGFDSVWIQPAAGDAGGALGATLAYWHLARGEERNTDGVRDTMSGAYLGPYFEQTEIVDRLTESGAVFRILDNDELLMETVKALDQGVAVGWFQGRMEFGPRALGNRSILADPRLASTQRDLNLKTKFRESFRPFAPAVLAEFAQDWFDFPDASPYMLFTAPINLAHRLAVSSREDGISGLDRLAVPRSAVPAVTHVDYSARLQTVHADTNPLFHALITRFAEVTGVPMLVNTSFNVRGEPIVASPEDAYRCFMGTGIEVLVIGNCILHKLEQTGPSINYAEEFTLD